MAGRVYAVLKRMQRAEGSYYRSLTTTVEPEQQLESKDVLYQLKDLNGHVISKQEAKEIIQEKFPSKAQKKRKVEEERKRLNAQNGKPEKRKAKENREGIRSLQSLSDQPTSGFSVMTPFWAYTSGTAMPGPANTKRHATSNVSARLDIGIIAMPMALIKEKRRPPRAPGAYA